MKLELIANDARTLDQKCKEYYLRIEMLLKE